MDRFVLSPTIWLILSFCVAANLLEAPAALAQRNLLIPLGRAWQNAYSSGNYREALKIAREAQTLASKETLKKGEMGVVLYDIGETLRCMGLYAEAEKLLKEALVSCDETSSKLNDSISLPNVYNSLPMVYESEGRYTEAEGLWQQCEVMTRRNPNFAMLPINHLAHLYLTWGKLQKCKEYVDKAGVEAQRAPKSIAVAYAAYTLAMYLQARGQLKEAEQAYDLALKSCAARFGKSHPYYARVLFEQAELFREESRYTDAENTLNAQCSMRDQQYDQAEPLLKEALALSQRVVGEDHIVTAGSARDLGELYSRQKKWEEAQKYIGEALAIDEKLYGSKAPQVAADLMYLATAYGATGKSTEADQALKRIAEIKNVLPGGAISVDVSTPASSAKDRPVTDKWALVIGVSNFKDASINLNYAAKDATDFKNFLVNSENFRADHVKLLTDERADRENIIGMLGEKWLGSHVKRDNLVRPISMIKI